MLHIYIYVFYWITITDSNEYILINCGSIQQSVYRQQSGV